MILKFENRYIDEWKNKLVFAPNGFGKTTASKKILFQLEQNNPGTTLLFTRRKMDELLNFNKNTFYFGEESKIRMENDNIERLFSKTDTFKKFIKKYYNVTSAGALKKQSFYFCSVNSTNLYFSFLLNQPKPYDLDVVDVDGTLRLDRELKFDLFENIPSNIETIKKPKRNSKRICVSEIIYSYLDELKDYSEINQLLKCPLCGKRFKNNENLLRAINKTLQKYTVLDSNNPADLVEQIYDSLKSVYKFSELSELSSIFGNNHSDTVEFKDKISAIINFAKLCECHKNNMLSLIRGIEIDGKKSGDIADSYNANKELLKKTSNTSNKSKMLSFIENEFYRIVHLDSSVSLIKNVENLSISIEIKNLNKPINASEVLSESESKRLSLAVLRAMIRFGKYDCLILDDPLDSYDDYYMSIVCEYISKLLKEPKLKSHYLFTNSNIALLKLSQLLKCESIILYENPDIVFRSPVSLLGGAPSSYFSVINANYKEINFINKSEINLLNIFLNTANSSIGSISFDVDLSYVAFLTTIRNINAEIIRKINSIRIIINKNDNTAIFQQNIRLIIEHCYMHYEPDTSKRYNSLSVKVADVYSLYDNLIKPKNPKIKTFSFDGTNLNTKRLEQCKKEFGHHNGSQILNLIFKKIIFISELKYEFEETMIGKLQNKFGFSKTHIDEIIETDSTGGKLQKAKSINKKYKYSAGDFLDACSKICLEYSSMVNEFDHAMALMFPPYLNTRIIDILKYKESLDNLKTNF